MKDEFLPYLPDVLPLVLKKLSVQPKVLQSLGAAQLDAEEEDLSLAIVEGADGEMNIVAMNSSEMEDLRHALEAVGCFAEKLGSGYAPFVAPTAQALLPIFEFQMSEEIRDLAFDTWGLLCESARGAGQSDILRQLCSELMSRVLPKLSSASEDLGAMKTRIEGVTGCLQKTGAGILSAEEVAQVAQLAVDLLQKSYERQNKAPPSGEDDDDLQEESSLCNALCTLPGALMQNYPEVFAERCLPLYLPVVQQLLQAPELSRHLQSLLLFNSMLEYLGPRMVPHWPTLLPQLLKDVVAEDHTVRAYACYGASFAARQPAFAEFAGEVLSQLCQMVQACRSRAKKKSEKSTQMAADNGLSAIAEILVHQRVVVANAEAGAWSVWLQALPVQEDAAEGQRNHKMLLELVQAQKPEIVAAASLPKALAILIDVYDTGMADEDLSKQIAKTLQSVGEPQLAPISAGLSNKQKKKLTRILREASRA